MLIGVVLPAMEKSPGFSQPHEGMLMQFHTRLGHLAFYSIYSIAKDPKSGIKITDHKSSNYAICLQKGNTNSKSKERL